MAARAELPSGTVTFLFTDIEGSTRLLDEFGAEAYATRLAEHRRVLREAFAAHGGVEVDTQGDAFFVAFPEAPCAIAAAQQAQEALAAGPIRVRMGIHSGEPLLTDEGYVGIDVHRASRVMAAGHGGQVLVSQATRAVLDGESGLTDLGRHRLRDLTEPQPLYQLGECEFPPLKTLYRTNLPVQPTPLVGREHELAEVLGLLTDVRLLTLTGAGGCGKTRLALQAAADLVDDYRDGVWWISLAALRDPSLVTETIAQVIGAKDGLAEHLRFQQALLLVDNFEHLLEAAPQIAAVLAEDAELRVLVTSRERLGLSAEQEYVVPTLVSADAVALFTARARQLEPCFQPDEHVDEICLRLDGLPLALELAAARVKVLSPEQIVARLAHSLDVLTGGARDAPERQRTLRATVAWSHDLLDGGEKRLFARLAVFPGSFDLPAAEAVCEAELDALAALVDKSLLRRTDEGRFFMLEAIREYGAEKLDESDESAALRERHAGRFLALAEQAEGELKGTHQAFWLERLEDERHNLRAALDWAAANEAVETELRLATALRDFWSARGPIVEALRRLEAAVVHAGDRLPQRRLDALRAASLSALRIGDHESAERLARDLLDLARSLGDRKAEVSALIKLSHAAADAGRLEDARSLMEQAVSVARDAGDANALGHSLLNFADLALLEGDPERAVELAQQSLSEGGAALDPRGRALALLNLAGARARLGDVRQAVESAREALKLSLAQGDRDIMAEALGTLAEAEAAGSPARAAQLLGAADALREEIGVGVDGETAAAIRAGADDETYERAYVAGRALSLAEALELALD